MNDFYMYKYNINFNFFSELPKSLPIISGGDQNENYKPGDTLNLTCISAPSNPPARLEWSINDTPVSLISDP